MKFSEYTIIRINGTQYSKSELLKIKVPNSFVAPKINTEGPHATPNSEIILDVFDDVIVFRKQRKNLELEVTNK